MTAFDESEWYDEDYTDFHAKVSIQLGELIHDGLFDWENDDSLVWDYYNREQYSRVMKKFVNRYFYRELGALPYRKWLLFYVRKMNEIMPKYKILYEALDGGMNPFQDSSTTTDATKRVDDTSNNNGTKDATTTTTGSTADNTNEHSDKYGKSREVFSDFPATQLGDNQDYADNSTDKQYEDIGDVDTTSKGTSEEKTVYHEEHQDNHIGAEDTKANTVSVDLGSYLDKALQLQELYNDIDVMILDDCNVLFSSLYSVSINGI